jgi:methyl-accepting chemotaxis protein
MKNCAFATKISLLFGLSILIGAGVTGFLLYRISALTAAYDRILHDEIRQQARAREMQVAVTKQVQEWKNVLLRGYDPQELEQYRIAFRQEEMAVRQAAEDLRKTVTYPEVQAILDEFTQAHEKMARSFATAMQVFAAAEGKNPAVADKMVRGQDRAPTDLIDRIVDHLQRRVDALHASQQATVAAQQKVLGLGGLALFMLLFATAVCLARALTKPVVQMADMATKIARGDIHQTPSYQAGDEIGTLAQAFRNLLDYLKDLARAAEALGTGDLTFQITARSPQDALSQGLHHAVETLRNLVDDTKGLIQATQAGKLHKRGYAERYQGGYHDLLQGVNSVLDRISMPITDAATVLERVAAGDLIARMQGDYQGDFATIKTALNTALANLDRSLGQVASGVEQVTAAAGQISTGSQALAQGVSEQASTLQEVSSSLQELSSMSQQNAANAQEARSLADHAHQSADTGTTNMQRLSQAIDEIKKASDETAKIVKTIDEIAFQTNLLALNAAVEAARAGDAGKGFAVVAEEVRNLAMRSAEAAKTTAQLIEEAVGKAEDGVTLNQEVLRNLEDIVRQVHKVTEVMGEIAVASEQQQHGIMQLNTAVRQLNQVTQQTASNAEEAASTAEALSRQAVEMQHVVAAFRLSQETIASPRTQQPRATRPWVSELQAAPMIPRPMVPAKIPPQADTSHSHDSTTFATPQEVIPFDEDDAKVLRNF